jgi:hypothetical protein
MTVVDRPTPEAINRLVLEVLESRRDGLTFPEVERQVSERLPNLASGMQVRQATWRLIRQKSVQMTKDMRVRKAT